MGEEKCYNRRKGGDQEQDLTQYAMKLPLFDDFWIDFRVNTVRRWFAPELHAVVQAGPYSSLLYDPERKV